MIVWRSSTPIAWAHSNLAHCCAIFLCYLVGQLTNSNPSACQVCLAAGRIWKNYPRRIQNNFAKDNFKNTLRDGGLNYELYTAFLFTVFALFTLFPLFALITLLSLIALRPLLTLFIPFTVLFCFTMLYNTVACMPLYIVIRLERYWNIFQ